MEQVQTDSALNKA